MMSQALTPPPSLLFPVVRARVLPTPAQACSMDDAYERQRLANIARNKEILDGLGLGSGLGPKEAAKKPMRPRAAHVPDNSSHLISLLSSRLPFTYHTRSATCEFE